MADSSTLDLGNTPGNEQGSHHGLMVMGAIAGIVGLIFLVTRNSSSSGATTGTAAALTSLAENQQNLQGEVTTGLAQQTNAFKAIGDNQATLQQSINTNQQAVLQQLAANQQDTQAALHKTLVSLQGAITAGDQAQAAALQKQADAQQNQLNQIQGDVAHTLQSIWQANGMVGQEITGLQGIMDNYNFNPSHSVGVGSF